MLSTPGLLWRAAEADVKAAGTKESAEQYVRRVKSAATHFLRRDELHDREAIMSILHELLHEEGQLVLALGGKSLGKSFLLAKLEERLHKEGELNLR